MTKTNEYLTFNFILLFLGTVFIATLPFNSYYNTIVSELINNEVLALLFKGTINVFAFSGFIWLAPKTFRNSRRKE